MSRNIFIITVRQGGRTVTETRTEDAASALSMFEAGMVDAGHTSGGISRRLAGWTRHLMEGITSYEVMDPDCHGSVDIVVERK